MGEFSDRLQLILNHYGFTAYRMAQEIGTNGANLSNLISGKFKPSFDFLDKLLNRFPELNGNWVITGMEPMFNDPKIKGIYNQIDHSELLESKNTIISLQSKTINHLEEKVSELNKKMREYELAKGFLQKVASENLESTKTGK